MNGKRYITLLLTAGTSLLAPIAKAQLAYPAFMQEDVAKQAGATTSTLLYSLPNAYRQTTRAYYDGLGRAIQAVAFHASPLQNDLIQPMAYDNLGRQTISYLPYAGKATDTMGSFRSNAISTAQPAFYDQTSQYLIPVDTAPHARQVFENSPLQRMLQAGTVGTGYQPGDAGTQHYKTVSYRPNTLADSVYSTGVNGTISSTERYAANTLWVTDGMDEDSTETLLFKDISGHTILKRQKTGQGTEPNLDTYYVYDNAGAIRYIIPPKALHLMALYGYSVTQSTIKNLIYKYVYDNMGRVIARTVPGQVVSYIIYDPLNRPVLAQDTNMAVKHQWYYIKYDAKGRPVISGTYSDATHTTPTTMQNYVDTLSGYNTTWYESRSTSSTYYYYTNSVFPITGTTPLAYNYYDNYDWKDTGNPYYTYSTQTFPSTGPEGQPITTPLPTIDSLKGVPTMSMKRSIGPGLSNIWLMNVAFYDKYGHLIQVQSNNQLNYTVAGTVTDAKTIAPDFTGKPMATKVVLITKDGSVATTNTILTTLNYDVTNSRLADVDQVYNSQPNVHIANYTYNELGQMVVKKLDSTATKTLQTMGYRYNIRGQLLTINNSKLADDDGVTATDSTAVFGMQYMYDLPDANLGTVTPSYSGRVSAVKWMTRNSSNQRTNERSYAYSYDRLGRYTSSVYAERTVSSTSSFNVNQHGFDEYGISYDENGNILTLNRKSSTIGGSGGMTVDTLNYGYDATKANQLNTVTDGSGTQYTGLGFRNYTGSSSPYTYDSDGNLISDSYKGLTIKYNAINLADTIATTAPGNKKEYTTYAYDVSGNVLCKRIYRDSTSLMTLIDYIGGFVFNGDTLSYFTMPEGRVVKSGSTLVPEYVISDQQGNARFSFQDNGSGAIKIIQENSYYAFGEVLANSPVTTPTLPNINLYNGGSEWQNEYSNLIDYHQAFLRNYDPAVARFVATDPQPESAESMSVYQYAGNNPVTFNDPMGNLAKFGANTGTTGFVQSPSEFDYTDYLNAETDNELNGFSSQIAAMDAASSSAGGGSAGGASQGAGGTSNNGGGASNGITITDPSEITAIFKSIDNGLSLANAIVGLSLAGNGDLPSFNNSGLNTGGFWNANVPAGMGFVMELPEIHINSSDNSDNRGGVINIYRVWETDQSTIDRFTTGSGINGYILERPGPSSTQSGQRLRIPAGTYHLTKSPGTALDKRIHAEWELYNDQVPTSRHILFHYGNTADQTDGCLIPGFARTTNEVYNPDLNNRATDALNTYINSFNGNVVVNIYDSPNP